MEPPPKIKLPVPHKIQNKLNALNNFNEQEVKWGLGGHYSDMFYIYLIKKHKMNCFVRDGRDDRKYLGMSIYVGDNKQSKESKLSVKAHFSAVADELVKCIKSGRYKTIIFPLYLTMDMGPGHANLLIYRKKLNHIEHFEPHGVYFFGTADRAKIPKLLNAFVSVVNEKMQATKKIKLLHSSDVCPRFPGLQALESYATLPELKGEPGGYCAAWSMFFADLCLSNPEIPSSELLTIIFNILSSMEGTDRYNYLKNVIRGYTVVINEKIDKYFSILYTDGDIRGNNTKIGLGTDDVLKMIINMELQMMTDPQFVDTNIQTLKNAIKKGAPPDLLKKIKQKKQIFEMYKKFDVISPNTSSPIEQPLEKVNVVCPDGKEINPKTGRCINIKKTLKNIKIDKNVKNPCPEGKEINPKTGRCINIKKTATTEKNVKNTATTATNVKPAKTLRNINVDKNGKLKTCPTGKILNFETGKCIKFTKKMAEMLDKDF